MILSRIFEIVIFNLEYRTDCSERKMKLLWLSFVFAVTAVAGRGSRYYTDNKFTSSIPIVSPVEKEVVAAAAAAAAVAAAAAAAAIVEAALEAMEAVG